MSELSRVASHCVWLGTGGIDLGALTGFFYAFDIRERILDLYEMAGGARMHPNYIRVGGVAQDLPAGFLEQLDHFLRRSTSGCATCAGCCRRTRSCKTA